MQLETINKYTVVNFILTFFDITFFIFILGFIFFLLFSVSNLNIKYIFLLNIINVFNQCFSILKATVQSELIDHK